MLGLDCKTNYLHFHNVGSLTYEYGVFDRNNSEPSRIDYNALSFKESFTDDEQFSHINSIYISYLNVPQEFNGLGIGDVLLQSIENKAADRSLKYLVLVSLMSYTPLEGTVPTTRVQRTLMKHLSKEKLTEFDRKQITRPKNIKFITDNYFDKNFYLYSTHGFFPYMMRVQETLHSSVNFLMKNSFSRVDTSLGIVKSTQHTPTEFKPRIVSKEDAAKYFPNSVYEKDPQSHSWGGVYSVNFSPFEIQPNKEDTEFLQAALKKLWLSTPHATTPPFPLAGNYDNRSNTSEFRTSLLEECEKNT